MAQVPALLLLLLLLLQLLEPLACGAPEVAASLAAHLRVAMVSRSLWQAPNQTCNDSTRVPAWPRGTQAGRASDAAVSPTG